MTIVINLLLVFVAAFSPSHISKVEGLRDVTTDRLKIRQRAYLLPPRRDHHSVLSIPRGGAFGLPVSSNHLAKLYVGFTAINGLAMAVLPTVAANLYGSAFDDSKESMLATLLLERQGDAVLGTAILLQLSTFTDMPIAHSVAWSTIPYVVSLVKFIGTGQVSSLGFDTRVAVAMLLSILLPASNILLEGRSSILMANVLATIMLLYGMLGSVSPGQGASMEGLDIVSSSPGK